MDENECGSHVQIQQPLPEDDDLASWAQTSRLSNVSAARASTCYSPASVKADRLEVPMIRHGALRICRYLSYGHKNNRLGGGHKSYRMTCTSSVGRCEAMLDTKPSTARAIISHQEYAPQFPCALAFDRGVVEAAPPKESCTAILGLAPWPRVRLLESPVCDAK